MSKTNAVMFLKAAGTDTKLMEKLSKVKPTVEAWLPVAAAAGFEITPAEMKTVAEKLLGTAVKGDAVAALTALQASGELSAADLNRVAGGAARGGAAPVSNTLLGRVGALASTVTPGSTVADKDTGPAWSNDPKGVDAGQSHM